MDFQSLVNNIESLPPLSDAANSIEELYVGGSDNVNVAKLIELIESDALLTANILKMINAPIYSFSKKIISVGQAVTLFGTDRVYGLVVNYSVREKIKADTKPYGLSNSRFNDMCHLQSNLMMEWFSTINPQQAEILASLALIMESGKLVLIKEIQESNYSKEFTRGIKACSSISEYEHDLIETTSYFLSGLLFEHWNLEPLYVEILKGLDFERKNSRKVEYFISSLDVVRTAINVKEILSKNSIERASEIVEDMGLDSEHFISVANMVKRTYVDTMKKRHEV